MPDVVLTKYEGDFSQIQQSAESVYQEFVNIEKAGNKAFQTVGATANSASKRVVNLNTSVGQFARELPALGSGLNTFFLAIGNQFGQLKDDIDRLNAANKAAAAQGMQTTSVWKALGSAIFSVNTAMSIGVTLLVLYGKDLTNLIADLIKGKQSLDSFRIGFRQVTETLRDKTLATKIAEYKALQHEVNLASKGFVDKDRTLKKYNETIGLTVGQARDLNQADALLVANKDAYIKTIVDRIAANNLLIKSAELRNEAAATERDEITLTERAWAGFEEFYARTAARGFVKTGTIEERIANTRKRRAEALRAEAKETEKAASELIGTDSYFNPDAQSMKKAEDALLHSLQNRRDILKSLGQSSYEVEKQIYARRIELAKDDAIQRKDIETELQVFINRSKRESDDQYAKLAEKKLKEDQDYADKQRKIREEANKAETEYEDAQRKKQEELYMRDRKALLENDQTSYDQRRALIEEQVEQGLLTEQEASNARMEINRAEADARLSQIAEIGNAISALSQLAGEDTEASKALAVAATTIETYVAAQRAFTGYQSLPQPYGTIAGTAAAAAAVISGLARVQKILSVNVPKPRSRGMSGITTEAQTFKDGVIDLEGPGTTTSDSIPAWLSRGESVIKASSTAGYRDELRALNASPLDYERLLRTKYVEPALEAERRQVADMADNIARSLAIHNAFTDKNIVKELRTTRESNKRDMESLTDVIAKNSRATDFEKRLYKTN